MNREQISQLEHMMGIGVQLLVRSKETTEACLDDRDPKKRYAALVLMTYHWGPTEHFTSRCERMALQDPEKMVRSAAISCLGTCLTGTHNRRVEKLLASIVCNESETYQTRSAAYSSLFIVSGIARAIQAELLANLRIPEDVNWAFVHSVLR